MVVMVGLGLAACAGITGLGDYEIAEVSDGAAPEASAKPAEAGSSSSSGDSAPAPVLERYENYAIARCGWRRRCLPLQFATRWGTDDEACRESLRVEARRNDVPREQFDACASKLGAATCADREGDFAECDMHGTRPNGAACSSSLQCANGRCIRDGNALCGVCADDVPENGTCNYTSDCARDFYCFQTKCLKRVPVGETCSVGDACTVGLLCTASHCAKGKLRGESCSADCRSSLTCNDATCEEAASAKIGDPCRNTEPYIFCRDGVCLNSTCTAFAVQGQECANNGTKAYCREDFTCQEGKCEPLACR